MSASSNLLPGVHGKDFYYVKYGGAVYVVYGVKVAGHMVRLSWKVDASDYKAFGIDPAKVGHTTKTAFKALQYFGDANEIKQRGDSAHPLVKYMKHLEELYGPVSWMHDKQFVGTMLMGYMEQWDSATLQQRLTQTGWYQARTAAQRNWEMNTSKQDRAASTKQWTTQIRDSLQSLYGTLDYNQHISSDQINQWATDVASGKMGNPSDGFQTWLSQQTQVAQKLEGTAAWADFQSKLEGERAIINKPEDVFQQIKNESFQWLGQAQPDDASLKQWAANLASGTSSQGDWEGFLQKQAQTFYPYLGQGTQWQQFASGYKSIAEQQLGRPVDYNDPLLQNLQSKDANGTPSGQAMSYDDFTRYVRGTPDFWSSPTARDQGFQVADFLNATFNGIR